MSTSIHGPVPEPDTSHATAAAATFFQEFFEAKSQVGSGGTRDGWHCSTPNGPASATPCWASGWTTQACPTRSATSPRVSGRTHALICCASSGTNTAPWCSPTTLMTCSGRRSGLPPPSTSARAAYTEMWTTGMADCTRSVRCAHRSPTSTPNWPRMRWWMRATPRSRASPGA